MADATTAKQRTRGPRRSCLLAVKMCRDERVALHAAAAAAGVPTSVLLRRALRAYGIKGLLEL